MSADSNPYTLHRRSARSGWASTDARYAAAVSRDTLTEWEKVRRWSTLAVSHAPSSANTLRALVGVAVIGDHPPVGGGSVPVWGCARAGSPGCRTVRRAAPGPDRAVCWWRPAWSFPAPPRCHRGGVPFGGSRGRLLQLGR